MIDTPKSETVKTTEDNFEDNLPDQTADHTVFCAVFHAEITARLKALNAADSTTEKDRAIVSLDQQSIGRLSRMDALHQQAMAQATHRRRLDLDPATLRCISCARG